MLVERQAAEATNTLHPERVGGGAAARTAPTPCSATAAAGRGSTSPRRASCGELPRGVQAGLVNWGAQLRNKSSASYSRIAGMTAIQTQAIFAIERHDRKFPTRVLFSSTPSLFGVAGCESDVRVFPKSITSFSKAEGRGQQVPTNVLRIVSDAHPKQVRMLTDHAVVGVAGCRGRLRIDEGGG